MFIYYEMKIILLFQMCFLVLLTGRFWNERTWNGRNHGIFQKDDLFINGLYRNDLFFDPFNEKSNFRDFFIICLINQ